ncbi:PREDICTED: inner centromere protein-like [Nicotiana attenuata]|uniref:inner centromere protein-like n=1 Tax=Nicotiana attenuata TaxID=49451 RepID=UPI0009051425|nr:PREDICTED: inner centromere protein-like [Nicotiana attenuata]
MPRSLLRRKREKKSPAESSKPKKANVQKLEADSAALTQEVTEGLCAEREESDDCPLAPRGRRSVVALKSAEPRVAESEAAEVVSTRDRGIVEGNSDEVPEPTNDLSALGTEGHLVDEPKETNDEAPRRGERAPVKPVEMINAGEPHSCLSFSLGRIRDARDMKTPVAGTSLGENSTFEGYFAGVEEGPDIDASLIFEESEKLRQQALKLSHQAFSKSQAELARCEDEVRKLISELDELKALYAQKEGELGDLRAHLERISREWADLDEKLKQKDDLMREELRVRDTEILGLKQRMDEVSSDKETLREKLTSSEAVELMSSYRKAAAAANARARKVSEEAEHKLSRALEHARLRSRRQTLEDVYAGGIDLSAEIERVKALEEKLAILLSSNDGSASGSTSVSEDDED